MEVSFEPIYAPINFRYVLLYSFPGHVAQQVLKGFE